MYPGYNFFSAMFKRSGQYFNTIVARDPGCVMTLTKRHISKQGHIAYIAKLYVQDI